MDWLTTRYVIDGFGYVTPLWGIGFAVTVVWGLVMWRWVHKKLDQLPSINDRTHHP